MPPGDLQPLDASGLINLEPPQQPVIMVNNQGQPANKKKRASPATNKNTVSPTTEAVSKAKKPRKTKKPFEELRRPLENATPQNGEQVPDSSNIKHLGDVHETDEIPDQVDGNGVGGIAENWSDQQTIKVKVRKLILWRARSSSDSILRNCPCDDRSHHWW